MAEMASVRICTFWYVPSSVDRDSPFLAQVTMVAGEPVEVQLRVKAWLGVDASLSDSMLTGSSKKRIEGPFQK